MSAAQVDHTLVTGTCFSCHNGTSKLSLTGALISNKGTIHLSTNNSCDACHLVGPKPWVPANAFDHNQKVGACVGCHDNVHTVTDGKLYGKDAQHLNTTTACDACHFSTSNWIVSATQFDHGNAIGSCASCHDGSHKLGKTGTLLDHKGTTHMVTSVDCALCHNTTSIVSPGVWKFIGYTHSSPNYVAHTNNNAILANCKTCHTANTQTIAYKQPSLVGFCASCHSTSFSPSPHTKYGSVKYTFTELKDCTGACHIYTDQTMTKIQTTRNTNTKHRPSSSSWN